MALDLAVLALLAAAALHGAVVGLLRQLTPLAAVAAGALAARHLAPRAAAALLSPPRPPGTRAVFGLLAFAAAAVAVLLAGALVRRLVQGRDGRPGPVERAAGALGGGAMAALVAWALLSAVALAGGPVRIGPALVDVRASDFGSLAARHNLLVAADPAAARALSRLLEAARDPARRGRLQGDPALRRLLDDPRLRRLVEGPDAAAAAPDAEALLEDEEIRRLLERLGEEPGAGLLPEVEGPRGPPR